MQTVDPETSGIPEKGPGILFRRIESFRRTDKAGKMPPEIVTLQIQLIPVPELSATRGSGEERCKNSVMQKHSLRVQLI